MKHLMLNISFNLFKANDSNVFLFNCNSCPDCFDMRQNNNYVWQWFILSWPHSAAVRPNIKAAWPCSVAVRPNIKAAWPCSVAVRPNIKAAWLCSVAVRPYIKAAWTYSAATWQYFVAAWSNIAAIRQHHSASWHYSATTQPIKLNMLFYFYAFIIHIIINF